MARNRVIYQSEALFISKDASLTGKADHKQLERVQSANFSYTINRQDVNQFGELARIDSVILDAPTVSTDFSYYLTDGFNERALGFYVKTGGGNRNDERQFASGHMIGSSGKNLFIVTGPEGKDLNGAGAIDDTDSVIGIGNCYVSDYTIDLAVGSIPTASVSLEAANVRSDTGAALAANPAVDQEAGTSLLSGIELPNPTSGPSDIKALRPGDITVSLTDFDGNTIADISGDGAAHVQSVSINMPLSRSPLQRLGSRFPFAREPDFPINVSLSVSAIVDEDTAFQLASKLTAAAANATVTLKNKSGVNAMTYTLKGAKVDSESMSSAIGSNKTVDLTLSAQIGGIEDTSAGLFVSGANTTATFEYE